MLLMIIHSKFYFQMKVIKYYAFLITISKNENKKESKSMMNIIII